MSKRSLSVHRYTNIQVALLFFTLLLLGTEGLGSAESPWVTARETSDGIVVKTRERPGSSIRAVLASMKVAASPNTVIEAAADPATYNNEDNYLENQQVYKSETPNIWHVYYLVNFPFITRRDYTLRYEKSIIPEKDRYQLSWSAAPKIGPPPSEDVIRVTLADGWVKAAPNGKGSFVEYYVLADPRGSIPGFVVNIANKSAVPNILRQIRDAALKRAKSR
jgi:hypothetical protein